MAQTVECYFLPPNEDAPNSRLPVLHYRNVLPTPNCEDVTTKFLTSNRWEKRVSTRTWTLFVGANSLCRGPGGTSTFVIFTQTVTGVNYGNSCCSEPPPQ